MNDKIPDMAGVDLIRTGVVDEKTGELKTTYIPTDKARFKDFNTSKWTKEMELYKKKRIIWLEKRIKDVEKIVKEGKINDKPLAEWDKMVFEFFLTELKIDFNEDKQRVKYKGKIPKDIDDKAVENSKKEMEKWVERVGELTFYRLRQDCGIWCWGNIKIEGQSSAGGKE